MSIPPPLDKAAYDGISGVENFFGPCRLFSRAQDALKTSGDVIESSFYGARENLSSIILR